MPAKVPIKKSPASPKAAQSKPAAPEVAAPPQPVEESGAITPDNPTLISDAPAPVTEAPVPVSETHAADSTAQAPEVPVDDAAAIKTAGETAPEPVKETPPPKDGKDGSIGEGRHAFRQ